MEHLCELHGQQPPEWLEEPELFLEITWILPTTPTMVTEAIAFAPAAFIRHGVLPDPRCLDARGVSDTTASLDRSRIMKLFETLSARLAARGIRGQLYIVGGSAMIVGYGRERTTRDVDARISRRRPTGRPL